MIDIGPVFGIPIVYNERCPVPQTVGIWPFHRIVVGPSWLALTQAEREAVLHHEAAHCLGKHRELRVLYLIIAAIPVLVCLPFAITLPILLSYLLWELAQWLAKRHELEADEFAASQGHGAGMLQYLNRPEAKAAAGIVTLMEGAAFYPNRDERARALETHLKGATPCRP